jgi:hypothetical protein
MNRQNITLTAKITASETETLYEIARSKGIQMPHPALGIFTSVLAEIEKANGNGVRLGSKATDAAVSTLIGTQINRNHLRTDNVLGHIIDASINKDKEIEVTCIFFKDIYEEEWDEAQELFSQNQLTMSFELSADVESQDKLADGTKRLNDYYFTGAGLLFGVKPACKKARVFEIATKKLQEKLNMERQSLIFANNQNSQKSIMEVLNLMADEVKKIEEVQAAEVTVETPVVEPTKAEEVVKVETPDVMHVQAEEVKVEEPVKAEEPVVAEAPVVEAKVEEAVATPEVKVEEAKVEEPVVETKNDAAEILIEQPQVPVEEAQPSVTVREEIEKVTIVTDPVSETQTVTEEKTTKVIEDNQVVVEKMEQDVTVYTMAQVDEIKAGYEKQISELKEQLVAKDKEVETLKAAKKEEIVVAEEKPILATGHKKMEAAKEDVDDGNALVRALRFKKANRKN